MTAKTANTFALIVVIGFISIPLIFYYVSHDFNEICDDNQTTSRTELISQNNYLSSSISNSCSWSKEDGTKSNKSTNVSEVSIRVALFDRVKCSKEIKHFIEQNINVSKVNNINTVLQNGCKLLSDGGFLVTKAEKEIVMVALSYDKRFKRYGVEMLDKNGNLLNSISFHMLNNYKPFSLPRIALENQILVLYYHNYIRKYEIPSGKLMSSQIDYFKNPVYFIIIDAKSDPITNKTYVLDDDNKVYLNNYENDTLKLFIETNKNNGITYSMAVYNDTFYYLKHVNDNSTLYFQSNVLNSETKIGYACSFHLYNRINVYKPGFLILSCYKENLIRIYTLDGHFVMNFFNRSSDAEKTENFYFDTNFYLMTSNHIEIYEFNRKK